MASNGLGSVNSTVNINVEYAPELICPVHYEGKEGKKHNLNCTAEGIPTPTVIWRKYGKELDLPMIMTRNDRGNYTVSANNKHGTAKKEVDVDILYAPEFLPGEDTVELSEGSDETLVCSANGNPPPKLKWTDVNALNVHVTTEGRQSTIRITGATSTNTGSYNCTATNSVGTVTRTTTVRMKDPPSVMVYLLVLSALVFFIIIIIVVILRYCIKRRGSYQFTPIPQGTGSLGTPLIPLSQTSNGTS